MFSFIYYISVTLYASVFVSASAFVPVSHKVRTAKFVMISKSGATVDNEISNVVVPKIGMIGISKLDKNIFNHMGGWSDFRDDNVEDKKKSEFNLNVGRALEVLRRELPMVFYVSNYDFSIFANQITVCDGSHKSRVVMQKSLYSAAVKSLRVASSVSFTYPSMNVKKIEYIESCRTIQCNVDIVLPDTIRIDGQAVWEGMFFFGLDETGLISTHIFDRKISNLRPSPLSASAYPWLRASPSWSADLLVGASGSQAGIPASVFAADSEQQESGANDFE